MQTLNAISLFSGIGGLDLGIKMALPQVRTCVYVEIDPYCQRILEARMCDGSLDQGAIWDDITTFDGRPWHGRIDMVSGGFPCQDISVAGKGGGIIGGKRSGLWREYARLLGEIRPTYVFIENVAVLLSRGLDIVLSDLAALGYDAEWGCFRASDVGAPHRRERVFILAYARCGGNDTHQSERQSERSNSTTLSKVSAGMANAEQSASNERYEFHGIGRWSNQTKQTWMGSSDVSENRGVILDDSSVERLEGWREGFGGLASGAVANATCERGQQLSGEGWGEAIDLERSIASVGNPTCHLRRASGYEPSQSNDWDGDLPLFPPRPADHDAWRVILEYYPDLAPAIDKEIKSAVRDLAHGAQTGLDGVRATRMNQLRALGNCVVPQCAELAFRTLAAKLFDGR